MAVKHSRRPETGVMEFDGDWRGVFIRGDNALMGYLPALQKAIECFDDTDSFQSMIQKQALKSLVELLASVNQHTKTDVQKMKNFDDCVKGDEDEEIT